MVEELWNGIRMLQPERGFRLGTDSVLLAEFLTLPPRRVLPISVQAAERWVCFCPQEAVTAMLPASSCARTHAVWH